MAQALSPRQLEILQEMAEGNSNERIGKALGITAHTVAEQKRRLFEKLGTNTSAGAVAIGLRTGLIS